MCIADDTILVIDFGSPITDCIAMCIQQLQVHSKICTFTDAERAIREVKPKGIILSVSPAHVTEPNSPRAPDCVFDGTVPVLGICYGQQLLCIQFGGAVVHNVYPEHGKTLLHVTGSCDLTKNIWPPGSTITIWMGHKDHIAEVPPGFRTIAYTVGSPHAIIADDQRKFYGVQFHPEVQHVKEGHCLIHAFVQDIVQAEPDPLLIPRSYNPSFISRVLLLACCG